MEIESIQLIQFSYIPFSDRQKVRDTIVQDIDGDIGAIGGGSSIGAVGNRMKWSVKRGFDRYELTDFHNQDLAEGNICIFNQTESVTDVVVTAELPPGLVDELNRLPRHIRMALLNAKTELEDFHEELLNGVNVMGTSTIVRVVPPKNSPVRANTQHLDLQTWGEYNQDVLEYFRYDPESYVSHVRDSFLLTPQKESDIWDEFVAVEARKEIPKDRLGVDWLDEYLVPLSVYLKVHYWQNNQKDRLQDVATQVDDATDVNWKLTDEFDVSEIASEQKELRDIHDDWFSLHSDLVDEQDEITELLARVNQSDTPGSSYEKVINTPNKSGSNVDNRPLFRRLSDELGQGNETVLDRINQLDKRYQNVANYFSDRVQAGSTVLNVQNQKTNQRLQTAVVWLTVVLTAIGVLQGIDTVSRLNQPIQSSIIAFIICILLGIIEMLIIGRG